MKKLKAQNEKTGEIRDVIISNNGKKMFNLGCASVPIRDEDDWIIMPSGSSSHLFWLCILIANFIVWSMVYDK